MTQKQGAMHGRDHQYGGADPAGVAWESVGGAGGSGPWAYGYRFATAIPLSTTVTYWFDLAAFYTNSAATFDTFVDSGVHGIRVLQAGLYKISFSINMFFGGVTTPTAYSAQLWWSGGGPDFTESGYSFGTQTAMGVPYLAATGSATIDVYRQELWNYESSAAFPADPIVIGVRHNMPATTSSAGAAILIERMDGEVVGGIS